MKQSSENKKKDKTQEHIKLLESKYRSLCKKIDYLILLSNTNIKNVDQLKLKTRVDQFLEAELQEIIESLINM